MKRPSPSFAIPVCVSLALHAVILVVLPRYATEVTRIDGQAPHQTIAIPDIEPAPEPEPKVPEPEEEPLPEFIVGEVDGKGFASHEIPDKFEATAPEADSDQAYLSLDPSGAGDTGTDAAVASAAGKGAAPGQPGGSPPAGGVETDEATAARLLTPFGVGQELKLPRVTPKFTAPENLVALETGLASPADGTDVVAQAPEAPPTPPAPILELSSGQVALSPAAEQTIASVPTPNPGSVTPGGAQQPAADPARMSDSESDPFSKLGTVIFREGSLDIRFGRKVKTRRPKLLLAARSWDSLVISKPDVGLRIDVDAAGKVTSVAVIKSSGSNEIDQPTRVAVYDWWFEPKLDADGRPIAEQYRFVIGYR